MTRICVGQFLKLRYLKVDLQNVKYYGTALPAYYISSVTKRNFESLTRSLASSHASTSVPIFSKRALNTERGDFNTVEEADTKFFKSLLGDNLVVTDADELEKYNTDWLSMVKGASRVVLKPRTTEQVSKILVYCSDRNLAVCPQGGNTGLVGGGVPVFDEVIISTSLMNNIERVEELSGVVVCQAGVVLETLDQHVAQYGLMMPLDLGAKGSCQIGGNVSTNAGGLRLLRYGSLHGNVLGVEAVLPSGEIIDCLSTLKKDNTGYDLKQLFIGSEGTLGIVTKVAIYCPARPAAVNVAFLGINSFDNVLATFKEAKSKLGEILSSCEFIDDISMDAVKTNLQLTPPIREHKFYMLIETSGSNAAHDEEKLVSFLEDIMSSAKVSDGTVATEPSKILSLWALRERITEALLRDGYSYKCDVSVPLPVFYEVVEMMQARLGSKVVRCCGYGHIGDCNLHFNATSRKFDQTIVDLMEPYLFELVAAHKGSISAEHGVGLKKKAFIHYSKPANALSLMRRLKTLFDPKGILNPYKVLPDN